MNWTPSKGDGDDEEGIGRAYPMFMRLTARPSGPSPMTLWRRSRASKKERRHARPLRRHFNEVGTAGHASIASEALRRHRQPLSHRGSHPRPDRRDTVRDERSRPTIIILKPWLSEKLGLISQETWLAEAIRYRLLTRGNASQASSATAPHRDRLQYRRAVDPPDRV